VTRKTSDLPAIALALPSFDAREEERVLAVLRSGWVAQGPCVAEFERQVALRVGAAEGIATTSCTTSLFLALHALGIGPGDEVVVPSLSFIASANAVVHCGAEVVFVDVDPRTYNLSPNDVAKAIGPRTRAILAVHQVGLPADLSALGEIAERHAVPLVEDAACAIGARYGDQPIGSHGNLACWSFHPRKIVCTAEGGMITTDDRELATRLRRLRHQGMSISDLERHASDRVIIEQYPEVGYNFRMSDVHAALGLAQLEKLDEMLVRRRDIASRYTEHFRANPEIEPPYVPARAEPNFQSYLVRLPHADEIMRNRVIDAMQREGIATRRGLMAAHREAPYRQARRIGTLAHTESATDQTLALPIHAHLSDGDVDRVADTLARVVGEVAK
jgi:dTDP-4-amino-4,6-dideoxygalactose transaminase